MSEQSNQIEVYALKGDGFITLEVRKPNGEWVVARVVLWPNRKISVSHPESCYSPDGTCVEDVLPDTVDEYHGMVLVLIKKVLDLSSETDHLLASVAEIIRDHTNIAEGFDHTAVGA